MASTADASTPNESSENGTTSPLRMWGRRALWALGGLVGTVVLLIGVVLLILQTETGATTAAQFLARQANPFPGTELTVGQAEGSWVRSLRLHDVSLTTADTSAERHTFAHIDTVAVRYSLGALLRGRVHLHQVTVRTPSVTMRQAADSTWDWARILPESSEDTTAGIPIQIDAVEVTDGQLTAEFFSTTGDSTARVDGLRLQAHAIEVGPTISGRLDTLALRGYLPADTTSVRLAVRGGLSPSQLELNSLLLTSARSRVEGSGSVRLPTGPNDSLEDVGLTVQASPLVLGDLLPLLPTLDVDPEEAIRLGARVTGSSQQLTVKADAQFSRGGTMTLTASGTPRTTASETSPLQYEVDGRVNNVRTSLLDRGGVLNAGLQATLEGPALSALNGRVEAEVQNTRLYEVDVSDARLLSTLRDGRAEVDLQGSLNGTWLSVQGWARPLDDAPTMDVSAHVNDLSIAAVAPDAGVDGTVTATARVRADSMMTKNARYDITTDIGPSQVGRQRIESGTLSIAAGAKEILFDGTLTLPVGGVQARGQAALDGSEQFILETATLENVNVAALVGDTTASRVTGRLQAEGEGFDPETMRASARLSIDEAHYGPHRVQSLETAARMEDGRLTAESTAQINGSDWALTVAGQPLAPRPTVELTDGRFQHVDIGPFLQDTTQSSALHGTFEGRVRGTSPSTMEVDFGVRLDTSRVNRQRITEASVDLTLREGTLRSDIDLTAPEASALFALEARPVDDVPTYQISEGSFQNLNVGALAGLPNFSTNLSGNLTLEGQGRRLSELSLNSDLTLTPSTINRAPVSDGRLTVSTDGDHLIADGEFSLSGGSLTLRGTLNRSEETPGYSLRTTARSLDISALASIDSVQTQLGHLQWTVEGQGTNLASLTATTLLTASSIDIDRIEVDSVRLAGRVQRGLLQVDTLTIQSNAITAQGSGPLALTAGAGASKFDLRASVTDVAPLRRLTGADVLRLREGTLEAHVYGTADRQRFDGIATVDGLIYNEYRIGDAEVSFNGQRGTTQLLDRLEVDGTAGYLSMPGFTANGARLEGDYDGTEVDITASVQMDQQHRLAIAAAFVPDATPIDIRVRQLDLRLGQDRWSLTNQTTVSIGDQYRVDHLRLQNNGQHITANGAIGTTGTQDLSVDIEGFQLASVAPLIGLRGLAGGMTGTFSITGPATAPIFDGELDLDLRSEGSDVGALHLEARYEDLNMTIDAHLTHADGSALTAGGTVPVDLRLRAPEPVTVSNRAVKLDASTRKFPINWIGPFLDPETVRSTSGTLIGNVSVRGTLDDPDLSGTVSVSGAGAYIPALETAYRNGSFTLTLADDQITIKEAVIHSKNEGSLRAKGVIDFPELTVGEYGLSLDASNLIAIDTRAIRRAIINGNVTLRGTTRRPVLDGNVRVQGGSVYYSELLAGSAGATTEVTLTPEDQLRLEERFGVRLTAADTTTFDFYDAMELDLSVRLQRDTWLRSTSTPEMNIQLSGNLDVQKAPSQDPRVFGTISVIEGQSSIRQFGQEFQITEGSLTFNGNPYSPYLDLSAVYEKRARGAQGTEVRITLSLTGRPEDLSPSLSSEPSMTTRNILSYLATGRPADDLFTGGSEGGSLATQVALGQASNFVENLAASELGLDVVRLDVRTEGISYLTVGRYLTPRFFASIEQPVIMSSAQSSVPPTAFIPDVTLEFQLTDYLLLRTLSGQQAFELNLLFEYAY